MRPTLLTVAVSAVLLAGGCSTGGGDPDDAAFDDENGAEVTCLAHQRQAPGRAYAAGADADTAAILRVLRYYTAHGGKPYCDKRPPNDADRRWAELYVQLGADRANVTAIVDGTAGR